MLDQIQELFDILKVEHLNMTNKIITLQFSNETLHNENIKLSKQNKEYQTRIADLQTRVEDLEDDRRELTKVSSIINMEKQNRNLKVEIDTLHEKLNKLISTPIPLPKISNMCVSAQQENSNIQVSTPLPLPENSNIQVSAPIEKIIKGSVYYIQADEVFIKNQDSSIGNLVGKLTKLENNKTKVIWLKCPSLDS